MYVSIDMKSFKSGTLSKHCKQNVKVKQKIYMDVKGDFLQSSKKKKFKVLQFDYLNAYL